MVDESSWRNWKFHENDFLVDAKKAGSEKLGMTLKIAQVLSRLVLSRNDKTWAILTPRNAHLAMRNSGASIRIGRLGRRDAC